MSGDQRPPWMFDPNRISSNGFLIRPDNQPRYYFRTSHIQESPRLEKTGPRQINWPALVAGITIAVVLAIVIIVVTVVVTKQSPKTNEVTQTTQTPNSSLAQLIGPTMTPTTTTPGQASNRSIAPLNAVTPNPNPRPVQLPNLDSTTSPFWTDRTTSSSLSTTPYSPAVCSDNTWIKLPNAYASSTFYQSGITSPAACQSACLQLSSCGGIMWYLQSAEGCYLVYTWSFISYDDSPYYVYYSLIRNQSNCDANDTCIYVWSGQYNRQALGGVQQSNLSDLNLCIASCQNNPNCSAVDFDVNQRYCWHFQNTNESSQTQLGPGIRHFDKDCRDPRARTTTSALSVPATSSSLSTTPYSPAVCSDNTWIKLTNVYASSSFYQSGITSPAACQSACLQLSSCGGIMWYMGSAEGCYLVYNWSFISYNESPYYVYYSLIRNQSNCDPNDTCIYVWSGQYDRQALGAVRQQNLSDLNLCITSCQNNPNCSAVDFDVNQRYCWHFLNTNESSQTQLGPGIRHFDKECRDPYATTTTAAPSVCPYWAKYCEPTGQCIYSYQMCDRYQDCPNDFDESNCTCDSNHYQCKNGRCIYKSWLCDGVEDCPLKDDESSPQCSTCNSSQFLCGKTHTCISTSQRCDGVSNCSGSEDEVNCLMLVGNGTRTGGDNFTTYLVNATYRGISNYLICSDNWNETWSDSVCQNIGYRKSSATSFRNVTGTAMFLALNLSVSSPNLLAHLQTAPSCMSNKAVAVSCSDSECGTRGDLPPDSFGPYIINGQRAKRGAWPWQVLYEIGFYSSSTDLSDFTLYSYCGGVILNERWILTAAHCTQAPSNIGYSGNVRPENVRISVGSVSRLGDNDTVYARIDQVYTHPSYTSSPVTDNDVGLLRLSEPLNFTDTIRPICLPKPNEDISKFRVCVDTGFGQTNRVDYPDYLLQARMNIIPYKDCYYYIDYFLRGQTQICIGTLPTEYDNNICLGDSGGPFACEDYTGVWKVIGINSYVIGNRNSPTCSRSIVARVTAFADWIQQTMAANSV